MFKDSKKENNVNAYITFISKVIKDKELRSEVIEKVEYFSSDGIITIDGSNLTGKIIREEGNLYLDIKYDKGKFVCSYTKWDINSLVLIEQEPLKNGNYKLTKTEKVKYKTPDSENIFEIEIEEKIYNSNDKLVYDSRIEIEESFDSQTKQLVYVDDSPFINMISIEKKWYMHNGSIILYNMEKNELNTKKGIQESYLICKKPYVSEFGTTKNFIFLGRDLFIELMTGKLTIEEVLIKLEAKAPVKKMGVKNEKDSN